MENKYVNRIRIGSFFPSSSSATICNAKTKSIEDMESRRTKDEILKYLDSHRGAYISELSQKLHVEPKKIVEAIRALKDEGLLA